MLRITRSSKTPETGTTFLIRDGVRVSICLVKDHSNEVSIKVNVPEGMQWYVGDGSDEILGKEYITFKRPSKEVLTPVLTIPEWGTQIYVVYSFDVSEDGSTRRQCNMCFDAPDDINIVRANAKNIPEVL